MPSRSRNLTVWLQATHGIGVSPADIGVGERLDHRLAEARLVVEHVMRECRAASATSRASWMSLAGAAGALLGGRRAMVVKLQRDADDVVAGAFSSPATTEESTPPDIATTTRVVARGPGRSSSMSGNTVIWRAF